MSSPFNSQLRQILIANYDYQAITEKELSFQTGDKFELLDNRNSDWWFVSKDAIKGYIPSNYMSIFQNHTEKDQNSSGYESEVDSEAEGTKIDGEDQVEEVIDSIRRKQSQSRRAFMVDYPNAFDLDEFPNMSMGFRRSTLGNCLDNGIGLASHHLVPELNSNGLGFKDLYLENKTKVRRRQVKTNLCISIVSATDIPFPAGHSILGRCIHVSLMDNSNVISNIHTIAATLVENKWYFNEKISLFQTDKENKFFVRTSNQSVKLKLLFEICLIVRKPNSSKLVKICCGWAMLPIYKPTGESIDSQPYKVPLLAGTPFENNISLASAPIRNPFRADFTSALPKLELKVWKPNSRFLSNLKLPDTFISKLDSVEVLAVYRRVLANSFLATGNDLNLGSKYEPALAIFLKLIGQPDLFKFLVQKWTKNYSIMSREDRNSYSKMKQHFTHTVMTVYPLLYVEMPNYVPGMDEVHAKRNQFIKSLEDKGVVGFLTSHAAQFQSFDIDELDYNYCNMQLKV